jgi:acetyl esterase/lipase
MRASCSTSRTTAYGIEAFNARNPLAWPRFATREDVGGLPPTVISVNECEPLRDEGIAFYRLLLASGVSARCRQMMGACHGIEIILPVICPDIAHSTASDIANFRNRALRRAQQEASGDIRSSPESARATLEEATWRELLLQNDLFLKHQ